MTLSEMIRKRGRLLSILDLVELMERADIQALIRAVNSTSSLEMLLETHAETMRMIRLNPQGMQGHEASARKFAWEATCRLLVPIQNVCNALNLTGTPLAVSIFKSDFDRIKPEDLPNRARMLNRSLYEELGNVTFGFIQANKISYWTNPKSNDLPNTDDYNWDAICVVLPKSKEQIKLAGRCFAEDQPTACVFHLCCAVETGIRWLPKKFPHPSRSPATPVLGIKAPGMAEQTWRNWRTAITNYTRTRPKLMRELDRIADKLESMERGVRNQVMHPNCELGDRDARLVFDASHSILSELVELKGKRIK